MSKPGEPICTRSVRSCWPMTELHRCLHVTDICPLRHCTKRHIRQPDLMLMPCLHIGGTGTGTSSRAQGTDSDGGTSNKQDAHLCSALHLSRVLWGEGRSAGVDGSAPVATPCIVVAFIVDERVLVRLPSSHVPVVFVVQILVAVIVQLCRVLLVLHSPLVCHNTRTRATACGHAIKGSLTARGARPVPCMH